MVNWNIQKFDVLDSTNSYLKALANEGAPEGVVIVAEKQNAGRGRRGKSFYSPEKTGLYMSFLIRPKLKGEESLFITTATAVALCRAIEKIYTHTPLIKWVNDIYLNDRKVAGILTEASYKTNNLLDWVVVGVGVNINTESFPDDIKDIALSLGKEDKRDTLRDLFLREFDLIYDKFPSHDFFEEYRSRSLLIGREVEVVGKEELWGKVTDVDKECHLIIQTNDNKTITLSTGEVSTRLKKV